MTQKLVQAEDLSSFIVTIRGQRVMLDADLAVLYGVSTARLNQQVQRNEKRFPPDFIFRLSKEEFKNLRLQNAISSSHGGRRYPPYVFTEHGAIMAATVLNSPRAVAMTIEVVRAFVQLKQLPLTVKELALRMKELESKHKDHDDQLRVVFEALQELMTTPEKPRRKIGFKD